MNPQNVQNGCINNILDKLLRYLFQKYSNLNYVRMNQQSYISVLRLIKPNKKKCTADFYQVH